MNLQYNVEGVVGHEHLLVHFVQRLTPHWTPIRSPRRQTCREYGMMQIARAKLIAAGVDMTDLEAHHIDGDRTNDNIANLVGLRKSFHSLIHFGKFNVVADKLFRYCTQCNSYKTVKEFYVRRPYRLSPYCILCHNEYNRQQYWRNKNSN